MNEEYKVLNRPQLISLICFNTYLIIEVTSCFGFIKVTTFKPFTNIKHRDLLKMPSHKRFIKWSVFFSILMIFVSLGFYLLAVPGNPLSENGKATAHAGLFPGYLAILIGMVAIYFYLRLEEILLWLKLNRYKMI